MPNYVAWLIAAVFHPIRLCVPHLLHHPITVAVICCYYQLFGPQVYAKFIQSPLLVSFFRAANVSAIIIGSDPWSPHI